MPSVIIPTVLDGEDLTDDFTLAVVDAVAEVWTELGDNPSGASATVEARFGTAFLTIFWARRRLRCEAGERIAAAFGR